MPPKKDKYGKIQRSEEGIRLRFEDPVMSVYKADGTPIIIDGVVVNKQPNKETVEQEETIFPESEEE